MKKLILAGTALFFSIGAFAQTTFGIKAGPDFSSLAKKIQGSKITSKGLIGLEGGVYANIPAAPELIVQPALLYSGKGGQYNIDGYNQTQRLNYLTVPIDLLYKPEMPNGSGSWFVGAGPYFAYGFSGKVSDNSPNSTTADPFKNYGGGASLKRFDAGADVQVGYEMASGFNIGLSADLGLLNIAATGNQQGTSHNTSFAILLGYTFKSY